MEGPVLTATIAASVTVLTLLVGKWIDSNHKRTDTLRGKLEDLFRALDSLMKNGGAPKVPHFGENESRERKVTTVRVLWSEQQELLLSSVMDCHVIGALYFPSLEGRLLEVVKKANEHSSWICDVVPKGSLEEMLGGDDNYDALVKAISSLKSHIIADQAYLTRKFPNWFEEY